MARLLAGIALWLGFGPVLGGFFWRWLFTILREWWPRLPPMRYGTAYEISLCLSLAGAVATVFGMVVWAVINGD